MKTEKPIILYGILIVVALIGMYGLLNGFDTKSGIKLFQGMTTSVDCEYIDSIADGTTKSIFPGMFTCPTSYTQCKLYVVKHPATGKSMIDVETLSPGESNIRSHLMSSYTGNYANAIFVGYTNIVDTALQRTFLGELDLVDTCPTGYSFCRIVAEPSSGILLPYPNINAGSNIYAEKNSYTYLSAYVITDIGAYYDTEWYPLGKFSVYGYKVLPQKTCNELGGQECSQGYTCLGTTKLSSDVQDCCIGTCRLCKPGSLKCEGSVSYVCNDDGTKWNQNEICPYGCTEGICNECFEGTSTCTDLNMKKYCDAGTWKYQECPNGCNNGACLACTPGDKRCYGKEKQVCSPYGEWYTEIKCEYECIEGMCTSCVSGNKRCSGNNIEVCSNGNWVYYQSCPYGCDKGICLLCVPKETRCEGSTLKTCSDDGKMWINTNCPNGCENGKCKTLCSPNENVCENSQEKQCSSNGMYWIPGQTCTYGCDTKKKYCYEPNCGDKICDSYENCESCPGDCGYCMLSLDADVEPTYKLDTPITITVEVDGTRDSVVVRGKIMSGNTVIHSEVSGSTINGIATLTFNGIHTTGDYDLIISATHPKDNSKTTTVVKQINFKSPLLLSLAYEDVQYTNEQIEVISKVTDRSGSPIEITSIEVTVTANNIPITCNPDADCWEETTGGEYFVHTYLPPNTNDGTVYITVTVGRANYETVTKTATILVKKPIVVIEFREDAPPYNSKRGNTVDVNVYTMTPQREFMDVDDLKLTVTMPNTHKKTLETTKIGVGSYITSYTFDQLEMHTFEAIAKKNGYVSGSGEKNTVVSGDSPIPPITKYLWLLLPITIALVLIYKIRKMLKK